MQDELQTLYTSGTVFHAFLGEKLPDWKAAANLVRKIAENYKLPYYTMSPTYSVCKNHGYITGEQYSCPHCGEHTEVYSRITGYYRPVQNWNDGKAQEFKDRKLYDIGRSKLTHSGPIQSGCCCGGPAEPELAAEPVAVQTAQLMLFATTTCPNCRQAEKLLADAGIAYDHVLVEENKDLAVEYGIRQAPTLVITGGDEPEKLVGVGAIRKFIAEQK